MRIKNRTFSGPVTQVLVIPRDDGDIVFKAQAVLDNTEFETLCPPPIPPGMIRPGQPDTVDLFDANYIQATKARDKYFTDWLFLKTIGATPDLVWDTVDPRVPETWKNYKTELKAAGFNIGEINVITEFAFRANSVDDKKLKEAKDSFLASIKANPDQNSPPAER